MKIQNSKVKIQKSLCHCEPACTGRKRSDVAISVLMGLLRFARNDRINHIPLRKYCERLKLLVFNLVLIIALCTSRFDQVSAQSLSLSISPPILELIIKPGKNITQSFKLTNDSDSALIVTPKLAEYDGESGIKNNPEFLPDPWISLLNLDISLFKPFLLEKGKTQQIVLRINPSREVKEGDYNRVLYFSTLPQMPSDRSQSQITQTIGIPLLLTVTATGNFTRSAQITKFTLPGYIDSFGPLTFDVLVKNTGQSYFHPNGSITFEGPIGRGSYSIIPGAILSQQEVKLVTDINAQQKDHTLSLGGFFLGKYTIGVNFKLDDGNVAVSEQKTVYALPFKLVSILIVLFTLFLMFRPKKKTAGNNKDKK